MAENNPHDPLKPRSFGGLKGAGLSAEHKMKAMGAYFGRIFLPRHKLLSEAEEQFSINPPRKSLLLQFVLLLFTAGLLALLSMGALVYLLLPVWLYLGYCVYAFAKLCRLYGYSPIVVTTLYLILALPLVFGLLLLH